MPTEDVVLNALPPRGFLREYVLAAMGSVECHVLYHVGCALSLLSQATALNLRCCYGTPIYANTYVLLNGSTGACKGQAITYFREVANAAGLISIAEEPGSREALVDELIEHPQRIICYPEFAAMLAAAQNGYLLPLKTTLTNAFDGVPLSRGTVRAKREAKAQKAGDGSALAAGPARAENTRLSLLAGSTTQYLERHTEPADWTGGFLSRFLICQGEPERTIGYRAEVDFSHLGEHLRAIAAYCGVQQLGGPTPGKCLGLDAEAQVFWGQWLAHQKKIEANSRGTIAEGGVKRGVVQALKVALLAGFDFREGCGNGEDWYIGLPELAWGCRVSDWHIDASLNLGASVVFGKDARDRRDVLEAVGYQPTSIGKILHKCNSMFKKRVEEILKSLETEEMIAKANGGTKESSGWYRIARHDPGDIAGENVYQPPKVDVLNCDTADKGDVGDAKVIQLRKPSRVLGDDDLGHKKG